MGSKRDAPLTVTFPIPRKAASKLRTMAVSRDRRLLDLGVLAVQINEGESIVLGIKLGKQRIKKTELAAAKLRGNASRGRVKKASSRRNVATIHHMPNDFNSQASIAHGLQTMQDLSFGNDMAKRKRVVRSDGDVAENNLFKDSSKTLSNPPKSCNQFRHVSHSTTSSIASSLSAHSSSADLSSHLSKLKNNSQDNSGLAPEEGLINSGSTMQKTLQKPSGSPASVLSRKTSVESLVSHGAVSSPASQRTYSASPSSDTSSTSSEENFDLHHDQLIYDCFVDRSKYSAADILKELAKTHKIKESTVCTSVVSLETHSSTSTPTIVKSSSSGMHQRKQSRALDTSNNRRSVITGSYREHLKSIRCNSLTCLTATTTTVSASLKTPASSTGDQTLGLQSRGTSIEKPLTAEDRIQSSSNQLPASEENNSQASNIKATSSTIAGYHGGRKVLWSSANAFPKSDISSAHFLFNKLPADFVQGSSSSNNIILSSKVHQKGAKSIARASVTSDAVTWTDVTKSVFTCTATSGNLHTSNKQPELDQSLKGMKTSSESNVINKMPTVSTFNSQVVASLPAQRTSSSHVATTAKSSLPVSTSTAVVQNLTLGRPAAIPTPIVIAGSNTQTTWSNQQVSPTYFVGGQRQYGIYSALYNADVNNNQPGQQAVTAAYPLNYVYPLSLVYPFLTMAAQVSDPKSSESSENENKSLPVNQNDVSVNKTTETKTDSDVSAEKTTVTTADLKPTTNTVAPSQMQFIDLASSMRYWQQLSLLYRSRLQALASCNLSNVKALNLNPNQINPARPATTVDSKEDTKIFVGGACENAVKSNLEEMPLSKPEISHANPPNDSNSEKMHTGDFFEENSSSESSKQKGLESKLEDKNELNNANTQEPTSFVVPSSCEVFTANVTETVKNSVKVDNCKQMEFDSNGTGSNSVSFRPRKDGVSLANPSHDQLGQTNDESPDGLVQESLKQNFYGSPPKLSFIHDSSIARVNVGSSIGNGLGSTGSNSGVRKTG